MHPWWPKGVEVSSQINCLWLGNWSILEIVFWGEGKGEWMDWHTSFMVLKWEWHLVSSQFLSCRSCAPVKSIKDIGSLLHPVWNFPAGEVGGKQWTLNEVEDYLRNPQPLKWASTLVLHTKRIPLLIRKYSGTVREGVVYFEALEITFSWLSYWLGIWHIVANRMYM